MATIKRAKRDTPFVIIDKTPLQDTTISWKAKGILAYLLSLPDDWKIYQSELQNHAADGKESTNSAIKELIEAGYMTREKAVKKDGKFAGYDYTVSEKPQRVNRSGKTVNGKPATTKNDNTKNEISNKGKLENLQEDLFKKVEGLKDKIGPNHYYLLNATCTTNKETYQKLRGMFSDGRFSFLMDFLEYKKESGKSYKKNAKSSLTALVNKVSEYTPKEVEVGLKNTLSAGYAGFIIKAFNENQKKPQATTVNFSAARRKANVI